MSLKFLCPHCGQRIEAAIEQSGSPASCPTCARQLIVPTARKPAQVAPSGRRALTIAILLAAAITVGSGVYWWKAVRPSGGNPSAPEAQVGDLKLSEVEGAFIEVLWDHLTADRTLLQFSSYFDRGKLQDKVAAKLGMSPERLRARIDQDLHSDDLSTQAVGLLANADWGACENRSLQAARIKKGVVAASTKSPALDHHRAGLSSFILSQKDPDEAMNHIQKAIDDTSAVKNHDTRALFFITIARMMMETGGAATRQERIDQPNSSKYKVVWVTKQIDRDVLAADFIREALNIYTKSSFPERWATTQRLLGDALQSQAGNLRYRSQRARSHAAIGLLNDSLRSYQSALEVFNRKSNPFQWGATQMRIAETFVDLAKESTGPDAERFLASGIDSFRMAANAYSIDHLLKTKKANIQVRLADSLVALAALKPEPESLHLADEAVAAWREVAEVYTFETKPENWATYMGQIGKTLLGQAERNNGSEANRLLEDAAEAFKNVLKVYSAKDASNTESIKGLRSQYLYYLGKTQDLLADRVVGSVQQTLRSEAVTCFEEIKQIGGLRAGDYDDALRRLARLQPFSKDRRQ